jgi:stalled ribosome rescue protein Dom34
MTINAGVWIDHRKAVVVRITNGNEDIRHIVSDDTKTAHSGSGAQLKNSYTRNDFVSEDKLERKAENHLKNFYDEVIVSLKDADSVLIIGPGEAKGELKKRIRRKKLNGRIAHVETVDKMTDPEIAEHFRQLLGVGSP